MRRLAFFIFILFTETLCHAEEIYLHVYRKSINLRETEYYESGIPRLAILDEYLIIDGVTFASNSIIYFYPSGGLEAGFLDGIQTINNVKYHTQILSIIFHDTGDGKLLVYQGDPAEDTVIGGIPISSFIGVYFRGVSLGVTQNVLFGKLSEDYLIFKEGDYFKIGNFGNMELLFDEFSE